MISKTEAMNKDLLNTIGIVKDYVIYQKSIGITEVPLIDSKKYSSRNQKKKELFTTNKQQLLDKLEAEVCSCKKCRLHRSRNKLVFGQGNPSAALMFIGEGPGRDEDLQGAPFVGKAGQLLTRIIHAMGLQRQDVYITNVIKCRPPENRNPAPDEIKTCMPILMKQIEIIKPKVIVCLGTFGAQTILNTDKKISLLRGKIHKWNEIKVIPTYHPAFLLRNPNMKRVVWEDMKLAMKVLKMRIP